jgi:hypothetical protein
LEKKKLLGLILDFKVENIDKKCEKLNFEFLMFGFEEFLSFFLVFVNFTENDFMVFD